MTKLYETTVVDKIENGMIYGYRYFQNDNGVQVGIKYRFMQIEKQPWFARGFAEKWKALELDHVSHSKLRDFEDIADGYKGLSAYYYFEGAAHTDKKMLGEPILNWILGPMTELMNERGIKKFHDVMSPMQLNEFVSAMVAEKFNKNKAKEAFREFLEGFDMQVVYDNPKYKIMDAGIVDEAIKTVIENNPEMVLRAKSDARQINWLVGQVMKACQGQAKAPDVKTKIEGILVS